MRAGADRGARLFSRRWNFSIKRIPVMCMVVGVLEVTFAVPAHTLKDKRSVIKRITSRTRDTFNVSIAEVDELDNPGGAVIGVVGVSNDRGYLEGLLRQVEQFMDRLEVAEIVDSSCVFEVY